MRIPVFLSCPTDLSPGQGKERTRIIAALRAEGFEWRSLGRTDYPTNCPLREVLAIARHCSGGVVLGYSQFKTRSGIWKSGGLSEKRVRGLTLFPTPWNNLEAGVLYALGLPLLVFCEDGVSGGIFDPGATETFIHRIPHSSPTRTAKNELRAIVAKWGTDVRRHYYGGEPPMHASR